MMSDVEERMEIPVADIRALMQEAGSILKQCEYTQGIVIEKKDGCANYATQYDYHVQQFIKNGIKKVLPGCSFFAEENDGEGNRIGGMTVYLDPIDGTMNFIHGCRECSISLAVAVNGCTQYAAVYLPYLDEMFEAQREKGATCNGRPIHVSNRSTEESLIIVGTASYYKQEIGKRVMDITTALFYTAADIRRYGSAVAEMCYVACGRAEASFEFRLYPWDYAAGALIVQEAGGRVSAMDGRPLSMWQPGSMLCGNPAVYEQALAICKANGRPCPKSNPAPGGNEYEK